jgi:Ca2+-binding EF-hand superfamily protein
MSKFTDAQLKAAFEKYDKDKSGSLDINELKEAVKGLGVKKSDAEIQNLVSE